MILVAILFIILIILTEESTDEVRCMICEAGHVDASKTGQKVALLLIEVRVARDLGVVGTFGWSFFILMMTCQ